MPLFKLPTSLKSCDPKTLPNMMCGIISYLPDDLEVREHRIKEQTKKFEWVQTLNVPVSIVEQNYRNVEIHDSTQFNVNSFSEGIGPQKARNLILREFYASDFDWILLLDDDCSLYNYYECSKLIKQIQEYPDDFRQIDGFTAWMPMYIPFKKMNSEDPTFNTHWRFKKQQFGDGVPILFLRNIKKLYNDEIYFDETFSVKDDMIREDIAFHIKFAEKYKLYVSTACIADIGNMKSHKSTLWDKDRNGEVERQWKRNTLNYLKLDNLIGEKQINWKKLPNSCMPSVYVEKRN